MQGVQGNVQFILIDFFDTIVHRRCHPDTIKQLWAKKMTEEKICITAKDLYLMRIEAERYLYSKKKEFTYEQLTEEICRRLCSSGLLDWNDADEIKSTALELELELEKKNQYLDEETLEFIIDAKNKKKKLILVSDFYMRREQMEIFLRHHKIREYFTEIFVSCDYKCGKSTGELYRIVYQHMNISPERCLMIGDNKKSDFVNAKRSGCQADWKKYDSYLPVQDKTYIRRQLEKIFQKSVHNLYTGYSFDLYFFTQKLYFMLQEQHIHDVFFLSREGEFLKEIFELFLKENEIKDIRLHYLYVSRRSTYILSLKPLAEEKFESYFGQFPDGQIDTFLYHLNFTDGDIEEIRTALGWEKERITKNTVQVRDTREFEQLIGNQVFIKKYEGKVKEQKDLFARYLKQFGVDFYKDGMCMVDVGWKGTMQDNLYQFFEERVQVVGYYLGLVEVTGVQGKNKKNGILFSGIPVRTEGYDIFSGGRLIYEKLLYASHPSTKEYQEESGKIMPVFDAHMDESHTYDIVRPYQEEILKIVREINQIFKDTVFRCTDVWSLFAGYRVKAFFRTTFQDIRVRILLEERHYENFGTLRSERELHQDQTRKEVFSKYKKYLKKAAGLFSCEHFLRVVTQCYKLKLYFLIPLYKCIFYLKYRRFMSYARNE